MKPPPPYQIRRIGRSWFLYAWSELLGNYTPIAGGSSYTFEKIRSAYLVAVAEPRTNYLDACNAIMREGFK